MAIVPVFCDNCRAVFAASGFIAGDARGLSLDKARLGPCPACGGKGRVPEGVFDFMSEAVQALEELDPRSEKLDRIAGILEEGASSRTPAPEIARALEAEAPGLESAAETVAEADRRGPRWIALLTAVVSVVRRDAAGDGSGDEAAERVTRAVVEELRMNPVIAAPSPKPEGPPSAAPAKPRATKRRKQAKTFGQGKKRRR